jgi:hypothetical protein
MAAAARALFAAIALCVFGGTLAASEKDAAEAAFLSTAYYPVHSGKKVIPEGARTSTANPHDMEADGRTPAHWALTRPGRPLKLLVVLLDYNYQGTEIPLEIEGEGRSVTNNQLNNRLWYRDSSWGKLDWEWSFIRCTTTSTDQSWEYVFVKGEECAAEQGIQ